ncbi:MAG: Component of type IV pili like system [Candidatus Methanohalarchaeum thermophilum]|uniref:Component of type IV pili like system n=1 Tax=Methanohalarchaeum thermophilum TaxID=1903181 RepID=A0A1Q6DT30_METT1|nr:MAG: Component of type IV pili like system [Candidatus Methanohalarchaeum thermophilum]
MEIVHAQTVLAEKDLEKLKEKTEETTTKKALQKAVEHYLKCPYSEEDTAIKEKIQEVKEKNKKEVKK